MVLLSTSKPVQLTENWENKVPADRVSQQQEYIIHPDSKRDGMMTNLSE